MLATRMIAVIALTVVMVFSSVAGAASDVSGKVVLANLDRYDAVLKIGSVRREIKPKKASALSPKKYAGHDSVLVGQHDRGLADKGHREGRSLRLQFPARFLDANGTETGHYQTIAAAKPDRDPAAGRSAASKAIANQRRSQPLVAACPCRVWCREGLSVRPR